MTTTHNLLILFGGAERDRTVGLLNAIQALSQLSYSPETDKTKLNIEQERLSIHPWFLNWFFSITKNFPFLHPIDEGSYDSPSSSPNFHLKFDIWGAFSYSKFCAGVVKLVDARDSKSRGASTPCRFDSDLRHQ